MKNNLTSEIKFISGIKNFKVGDKVKLCGDMGGFKMVITCIHNNHYCTAKGYGKERHFNMAYLEYIKPNWENPNN